MKYNDKEYKIINCLNQEKRSRYWCIIVYPDSCINEWINILSSMGIQCAISPLHDSDIFEDKDKEGQLKKPHYHVLIKFGYGARLSDIAAIADTINASDHVQIVKDLNVMYDYLTHKRNPEKHQYSSEDIKYINSDRYDYVNSEYKEILNYIDDKQCKSIQSLTWILRYEGQDKLLEYVSKNCYYVKTYIDSRNNKVLGHIQSILAQTIKILDNIAADKIVNYEEVKTLKDTALQYKDYEDLPF